MLDRSYNLRQVSLDHGSISIAWPGSQPINLFLKSADKLYGPITTIHSQGKIIKKIQWDAFQLAEDDW